MEMMIAGDLVPTAKNEEMFNKGEVDKLLGEELLNIWSSSDFRVFNLEVPLIDEKLPISKNGPNLAAKTSTMYGIKRLDPALVSLANNHILDQGVQGLVSTQSLLWSNNIPFVGAGKDLNEASKPYILEKNGISIGIYACAENEFTIATDTSAGANPFDPLESFDHIMYLKEKCDYVLVLYHGGKEHYRYPSPYLQKVCRKMVQKGADLVICQHSHCVGAYEYFQNSTIIYGQGNFIFDYSDNEYWQTSILLKINAGDKLKLEFIPIIKKKNVVRLALDDESGEILNSFHHRSREICQQGFIEQKYTDFAIENIDKYLRTFAGFGKWISRIDRKILKGLLLKMQYNDKNLLAMRNYVECEAHRELLLKWLKLKGSTTTHNQSISMFYE